LARHKKRSAKSALFVDIDYLSDHDEFVDTLVRWHHAEWAYLRPGETIEARTIRIRNALGRLGIPTVFVAFDNKNLLGSAMLVVNDMETRAEFSPWLAGVYVAPEYRGKGVGRSLVSRAIKEAGTLGVSRMYLYTPSSEKYYVRLGWQTREHAQYRGANVAVMSKEMTQNQSTDPTLLSGTARAKHEPRLP
jgi:predicted N-acetyltransferase YhbS